MHNTKFCEFCRSPPESNKLHNEYREKGKHRNSEGIWLEKVTDIGELGISKIVHVHIPAMQRIDMAIPVH